MNQDEEQIMNHYNNIIEFCRMLDKPYGATFYLNEINQTENIEDLKIIYDAYRLQIKSVLVNTGNQFIKNNWNTVCTFIKNNQIAIKKHILQLKDTKEAIDYTIIDEEKDKDLLKIIKIHALLGDS